MSFRLSGALLDALDARAETSSVSRGEMARRLVTEALLDSSRQELLGEVKELRDDVAKLARQAAAPAAAAPTPAPADHGDRTLAEVVQLREDLARSIEVILVNLGREVSEDEAADFVATYLRPRRGPPRA